MGTGIDCVDLRFIAIRGRHNVIGASTTGFCVHSIVRLVDGNETGAPLLGIFGVL